MVVCIQMSSIKYSIQKDQISVPRIDVSRVRKSYSLLEDTDQYTYKLDVCFICLCIVTLRMVIYYQKHVGKFMYGRFYVNYVHFSVCTDDYEVILFKIFLNYSSVPLTYQERGDGLFEATSGSLL
jgi:hypothetical protein